MDWGLRSPRGIVEAHGGSIGVDSEVGEGTSVWYTLSAVRPTVASEDPSGRGRSDLVDLLSFVFRRAGFDAPPAYGSPAALELLNDEQSEPAVYSLPRSKKGELWSRQTRRRRSRR